MGLFDIIDDIASDKIENDTTLQTTALVKLRKEHKVEIQDKTLKKQYEAYIAKNSK